MYVFTFTSKVQQNDSALLLELGKRGHDKVYKWGEYGVKYHETRRYRVRVQEQPLITYIVEYKFCAPTDYEWQ